MPQESILEPILNRMECTICTPIETWGEEGHGDTVNTLQDRASIQVDLCHSGMSILQNHRMAEVGRDLLRSFYPPLCSSRLPRTILIQRTTV